MSSISIPVAPQFDDAEQQRESSTVGMWIFLATEIMFFGGMFLGYTVYRMAYPADFGVGSRQLDLVLGGLNTAILLTSSLTMAMAVHSIGHGRRPRRVVGFLSLTILFGLAFLGIKFFEYFQKFQEHLVPGQSFHLEGAPVHTELFFSFYFVMTAMHALHMIIGISAIGILIGLTLRKRFSPGYYSPIEMVGLYWHFVDIVWVFLFPLLYLVDRS